MRRDTRSRNGRRPFPSRSASSRHSNVSDNRSEDQSTASRQYNPHYRAPAYRQDTPSLRDQQAGRGSASHSYTHGEGTRCEAASENLDTAGARWPLVDPSGVLYYIDDPIDSIESDLLREVISSGNSWSPAASRENSPFLTYTSLAGDYQQAGGISHPINTSRPTNSSRAGSASLDGFSSRAVRASRVGDRSVSPIEHDCGCTGEPNGICAKGVECCKYRLGLCCQRNADNISLLEDY